MEAGKPREFSQLVALSRRKMTLLFLKFQTLGEYERRKPQCVPLTNASEKALLVQTPP